MTIIYLIPDFPHLAHMQAKWLLFLLFPLGKQIDQLDIC